MIVRITDIHEEDIHYNKREVLIGRELVIDPHITVKDSKTYPGWSEAYLRDEDDKSGYFFFGFKFESVPN